MMVDIKLFVVLAILAAHFGPEFVVEALKCKCTVRDDIEDCYYGEESCKSGTLCYKLKQFKKAEAESLPGSEGLQPERGEVIAGCHTSTAEGTSGKCLPINTEFHVGEKCFCDTDLCDPPKPSDTPPDLNKSGSDGWILRSFSSSVLFVSFVVVLVPTFVGGQ